MLKLVLPLLVAASFAYAAETLVAQNFPNLLIPVNSEEPTIGIGTQYSGRVSVWHDENGTRQLISTEIVFDNIPVDRSPDYCTIEMDLGPVGPFSHQGGPIQFLILGLYGSAVLENDTWFQRPAQGETPWGGVTIQDGTANGGALVPCGQTRVQILLQADVGVEDFDFTWFELDDRKNGIVNGITLKQWVSE